MRIVRLISIFAFLLPAYGDDTPTTYSSGAALLAASAAADQVTIERLLPPPHNIQFVLSTKKEIQEMLGLIRFSEVPVRGEKVMIDGKEAWIVAHCQCWGDYEISFFTKGTKLTSFSLHHDSFIRVAQKPQAEFDLVPESGVALGRWLEDAMKERANPESCSHAKP